jgi:hypothetical protein
LDGGSALIVRSVADGGVPAVSGPASTTMDSDRHTGDPIGRM